MSTFHELGSGSPYFFILLTVSYTHLRAHETRGNLVCRLLLEKKNDFVSCAIFFFRLLGLSGFLRYDFEESGMKNNILSGQMWPSWVFGPGFLTPPAQLPARSLLDPVLGPTDVAHGLIGSFLASCQLDHAHWIVPTT